MASPETIAQAIAHLQQKGSVGNGGEADSNLRERSIKLLVLEHGPCPACSSFSIKVKPESRSTGVIFKCYQGGDPTTLFPHDWILLDGAPSCPLLHQP